jgi:hypothetical protein
VPGRANPVASLGGMARTYKLNHFTKGTGAAVEPLDERPRPLSRSRLRTVPLEPQPRRPRKGETRKLTPLPPGHVRKKATGELGRVHSVDAKAGTATVLWLRQGRTSTVPLAALSRR